jgi:hypothetical protein
MIAWMLARVAAVSPRVKTEHCDASSCRAQESDQAADRRRLARAIWAQEAEDLASADLQVDAPERVDYAAVLDQALDPNRSAVEGLVRWSSRANCRAHLPTLADPAS